MNRSTIVYANDENIGDHLSARGINAFMGGKARLFPFERRLPALRRMLALQGPRDTVVVGGGGLLKSSFDSFWRSVLEAREKKGFSLVLWGLGYCDVFDEDTRGDEGLLREVVSAASGAAFRDELSKDSFESVGNAWVVGCPSMALVQQTWGSLCTGSERRLLQVDHPDLLAGISRRDAIDAEAEFTRVARTWSRVGGLEHSSTKNIVPRVGNIPDRVRARMFPTRLESELAERRVDSLLSERYVPAQVVLTSRLHGAIIGAALGKRVVALSNDAKIDQFMAMIGLSEFVAKAPGEIREMLDESHRQSGVPEKTAALLRSNSCFASLMGLAPAELAR